jgi:hypothetical protein
VIVHREPEDDREEHHRDEGVDALDLAEAEETRADAFLEDEHHQAVGGESVDYQFRALREPQLIDVWQIQNQLLLTFSATAGNIEYEDDEEDE